MNTFKIITASIILTLFDVINWFKTNWFLIVLWTMFLIIVIFNIIYIYIRIYGNIR